MKFSVLFCPSCIIVVDSSTNCELLSYVIQVKYVYYHHLRNWDVNSWIFFYFHTVIFQQIFLNSTTILISYKKKLHLTFLLYLVIAMFFHVIYILIPFSFFIKLFYTNIHIKFFSLQVKLIAYTQTYSILNIIILRGECTR